MIPFVIDNQRHRMADALNDLLAQSAGKPVDVATAYFAISGYRLVRERLCHVGAFRLLIGAEPKAGADVGLRPRPPLRGGGPPRSGGLRTEFLKHLRGDLAAEPFSEATLRLVEELIALLRTEKVQVRLFDEASCTPRRICFTATSSGRITGRDRLRPFAAIVGSSNFTGPGLTSNSELNLVHRVLTAEEEAVDREAMLASGIPTEEDATQPRRT